MSSERNYKKLKQWLESGPTIQELKSKAKDLGLKVKRMMKKREVIKLFEKYLKSLEKLEEMENKSLNSLPSSSSKSSQEEQKPPKESIPEIPQTYEKDKLVLMPVNPTWLHVYWDFSQNTKEIIKNLPKGTRFVLRIYDVTFIQFNGNNAHRTFEILINLEHQKNYYFNVPMPNADYLAELGFVTKDGRFMPLLRSNVCRTPSNSPSQSTRERWLDIRKKRKVVTPSDGPVIKEVERIAGSVFKLEREISKSLSGHSLDWQLVSFFRSGRGI